MHEFRIKEQKIGAKIDTDESEWMDYSWEYAKFNKVNNDRRCLKNIACESIIHVDKLTTTDIQLGLFEHL